MPEATSDARHQRGWRNEARFWLHRLRPAAAAAAAFSIACILGFVAASVGGDRLEASAARGAPPASEAAK